MVLRVIGSSDVSPRFTRTHRVGISIQLKSTEFPCYRDHGAMKTSHRTRRETSMRPSETSMRIDADPRPTNQFARASGASWAPDRGILGTRFRTRLYVFRSSYLFPSSHVFPSSYLFRSPHVFQSSYLFRSSPVFRSSRAKSRDLSSAPHTPPFLIYGSAIKSSVKPSKINEI